MHENGEPIVWQLLVFAQGFDREDRSYLDDDPEAWIDESEGIVEEVDRHQACKWAISKEFSAMFKAGVDKGWSEAEVLAAITDSADIATLGHGHASEVETLLNNIARKAAENSKG
ncbi:hypothetical protein DTW90_22890 [Neorhizobium sp. P12A]|nr:hypothetical protein DTW90_22890 [Neorhizobium sp. P12A]